DFKLLVNGFDSPVDRVESSADGDKLLVDGVESFVIRLKLLVYSIESPVDGVESLVIRLKLLVYSIESPVDGVESSVIRLESMVDSIESNFQTSDVVFGCDLHPVEGRQGVHQILGHFVTQLLTERGSHAKSTLFTRGHCCHFRSRGQGRVEEVLAMWENSGAGGDQITRRHSRLCAHCRRGGRRSSGTSTGGGSPYVRLTV
ncbi:MAG: hypothetical protein O3B23_02740, partial [Actinomycetota bacterium]|nr:hypothetical protein [Actinomycetota bacterium]